MTSWLGKDAVVSLVTTKVKYQCHTSPWAGKAQWWQMGHAWMPFYCDTLPPSYLRFQQNRALHGRRLLHSCSSWQQELLLEDFGFTSARLNHKCSTSWVSQIVFLPCVSAPVSWRSGWKEGRRVSGWTCCAGVPQKTKGLYKDSKEGKAPAALPWAPAVRSTKDKGQETSEGWKGAG